MMAICEVKVMYCDICTVVASKYLIDIDVSDEDAAKKELAKHGWIFKTGGCGSCNGDYCPSCAEMKGFDG